jgi:arylsulfatase A-like enzyme
MISFVDMTPTFIDIAGGRQPDGIDGKSFLDVLLGKAETFRDYVYASHTRDGNMNVFPQRSVRDTRCKYVLNLRPENTWTTHFTKVPGIPESHKQVWDTWVEKAATDPIAGKPEVKPTLKRMQRQLKQWMVSQNDPALKATSTPDL